jgi:hypothetical protein
VPAPGVAAAAAATIADDGVLLLLCGSSWLILGLCELPTGLTESCLCSRVLVWMVGYLVL